MKDAEDFLKISEGKLGVINFNNMIPVPETETEKIKLESIKDYPYHHLLQLQLQWCQGHQKEIRKKAKRLYQKTIEEKESESILKRCCDFQEMEKQIGKYQKVEKLRETEEEYKISA